LSAHLIFSILILGSINHLLLFITFTLILKNLKLQDIEDSL